jgi:hypothetical protein
MDSNFQYAGAVNLVVAPRPPLRRRGGATSSPRNRQRNWEDQESVPHAARSRAKGSFRPARHSAYRRPTVLIGVRSHAAFLTGMAGSSREASSGLDPGEDPCLPADAVRYPDHSGGDFADRPGLRCDCRCPRPKRRGSQIAYFRGKLQVNNRERNVKQRLRRVRRATVHR